MREIVTTTANYLTIMEGGKSTPQVEVGIVTSEVIYGLDYQGVTKSRACETLRFATSPKMLRKLAEGLVEFADECEVEFDKTKQQELL